MLARHPVPSAVQIANAQTRSRVTRDTAAKKENNSMEDKLDSEERIEAVATFFGDASPSKSPQRRRKSARRKSRSGSVIAEILDDGVEGGRGDHPRKDENIGTEKGHSEKVRKVVKMFAEAGADVNLQTADGATIPFSLTNDNDELAYALVHFGASLVQ